MSDHPNAVLVRQAVHALQRGDLADFGRVFSADVQWHVPGQGPLSGTYTGLGAVLAFLARAFGVSGSTFRVDPLDIMASEHHAVLWQRVRAERDGRSLDVTEAIVFRIDGDQVAEVWERTDQYAFDDFFSVGETLRRRAAAGPALPSASEPAAFEISPDAASRTGHLS